MRRFIDFPADVAVLVEIGELVASAGAGAGFSNGEIGDIQLAVDEACTNTITHGLENDPSKTFRICVYWEPNLVEIEIHEKGIPFDITSVKLPDVDAPIQDRPIGGLGVYFIRKLMDEIEYRFSDDGIKILRMVKRKSTDS